MRTIATAGHVDHGKSSLVRALTGTDPDRFAEEKERGLTIDLGFAFTTLPSGAALAFVDVPGHVRFVKNMLAGVGAVEIALLVVGADDGWMPQSEEHLRILELLGVDRGVVVISKADLVDADVLELAQLEVGERLARSRWAHAPIVVCDSVTGRGLDELRTQLDALLADVAQPADRGRPRLWVDRTFAAKGAGTVVTGTLTGGSLSTDDELVVARTGDRVRVRGIQSGHRSVRTAVPGARVALNLTGVDHGALSRGDAVVRRHQWTLATVVDVSLVREPEASTRRREQLLAYAGSGEHHVSVGLLDDAGRFARVQFPVPVALAPGDHLVLRDSGRACMFGGATVLEVEPTYPPRNAAEHLALPPAQRLLASHPWLALADIPRLAGTSAEAGELAAELVDTGAARQVGDWLVATATLDALGERTHALVHERHRERPLDVGLELATLASTLGVDVGRVRVVVDARDDLVVDREFVRDVEHAVPTVTSPEASALIAELEADPFSPPDLATIDAEPALTRALLREGALVKVAGVVFTRAAVDRARAIVRDRLHSHGSITVGDARDLLASSRKYVVPLLERFDAEGVTRRSGDTRIAGPRAGDAADGVQL